MNPPDELLNFSYRLISVIFMTWPKILQKKFGKTHQLRKHIQDHDRVICCGHGSPAGLFSVGRFPGAYPYIVDDSMVAVLSNKTNSIFIWCYASEFIKKHNLYGFATSMFISQEDEAVYFNFWNLKNLKKLIDESNNGFAEMVAKFINEPVDILYQNVLQEYGMLAKTNPIALFNFKRLYLSQTEPVLFPDKVGEIL